MPDLFFSILYLILFFFLELLYFRIAAANRIIDRPNERSSHSRPTIRGGGIIFPVSVICWFSLNYFQYHFFLAGLVLISFISFLDDVKNLQNRIRSFCHFIAVCLLLYQVSLQIDWYWYAPLFILIIGFINAWNFMDGINGITGIYSLITMGTFWYINHSVIRFTSEGLLLFVITGLLVFNFFNFRKKARCFAGDVGSVSVAFIISFILVQLIHKTSNFLYIGFVLLYGLDAVSTILFRLMRRENIFEAHRSHFYQFLANEKHWPHLFIAGIYGAAQLVINSLIIRGRELKEMNASFMDLAAMLFASGMIFLFIRFRTEGKKRLLG